MVYQNLTALSLLLWFKICMTRHQQRCNEEEIKKKTKKGSTKTKIEDERQGRTERTKRRNTKISVGRQWAFLLVNWRAH